MSSKSSKKNKPAGGPEGGPLIELGRIVGAHGLRGEVRVAPHAPPCPTLRPGLLVRLHLPHAPPRVVEITGVRTAYKARQKTPSLLLALAGVSSRSEAEGLCGATLLVDEAALPRLAAGEFYHYRLIGLAVKTVTNLRVGDIAGILTTPAHDVLVVRDGTDEHLIPVVADVIHTIDLSGRRVVIDPPPGLLEAGPRG